MPFCFKLTRVCSVFCNQMLTHASPPQGGSTEIPASSQFLHMDLNEEWGWSRKQKGCSQELTDVGRFLPRISFSNWVEKERETQKPGNGAKFRVVEKLNSVLNGSGWDKDRDWGWVGRSVAKEADIVEQEERCNSGYSQVLRVAMNLVRNWLKYPLYTP